MRNRFAVTGLVLLLVGATSWGALTVNNGGGATNITSTSAWIRVSVVSTGAANPTLFAFWGTNNASTNLTWRYTNNFGTCTVGTYSVQATGLTRDTLYYSRAYATNISEKAWAEYSSMFRTIGSGTTAPPASVKNVTVDTNAVLKNPTNFFVVNSNLINATIGGTYAKQTDYQATSNKVDLHTAQIGSISNQVDINTTNALLLTGTRAMQSNLNLGGFSITNVWASLKFTDSVEVTSAKIQLYDTLDDSTNALNTRAGNLETATNALNTRAGKLESATNVLNTRAGNLETATNTLQQNKLSLSGNTMTGPLTNTAGFYGNGAGLTNLFSYARKDLASETFSGNITVATNVDSRSLKVGFGDATFETDGGAANFGYSQSSGLMQALQIGSVNFGRVMNAGSKMISTGYGSINAGQCNGAVITNSGVGSIALGNSENITCTNNTSIILGAGVTYEDRSMIADVFRARANFIGNGAGLTNIPSSGITEVDPIWGATSNQVQTDIAGLKGSTNALNTRAGNLETATNTLNTRAGNLESATNALNTRAGNLESATNSLNAKKLNLAGGIMTGPLTNTVGYYGNGAGLTNLSVGELNHNSLGGLNAGDYQHLSVAEKATATNAIRADGSVVYAANQNFGGQNATNIAVMQAASVQITGGSPTNGQAVVATNNLGQLGFYHTRAFRAGSDGGQIFSTSIILVTNNIEEIDSVNEYDPATSKYTPTMPGYYTLGASVRFTYPSSQRCVIFMQKNGAALSGDRAVSEYFGSGGYPSVSITYMDYNAGTGAYYNVGGLVTTASITNYSSFFWGAKLP